MDPDQEAELGLIKRSQEGDDAAYGDLVTMHQDRIFAGVVRQVRDEHLALDITQDAFVQAYKAIDTFDSRAKFTTWLYRIAMNLITSHYRHQGAQKRGGDKSKTSLNVEGMPEPGSDERSPDELAEANDTGAQVRAAIDSLEEDYRVVVVLRDLQDMSYEEIAETLDIAAGTVRSRLHRGREKLKEKLAHLI
jgi:RNA polymerase sigma-70 factor (ECF subfamily)